MDTPALFTLQERLFFILAHLKTRFEASWKKSTETDWQNTPEDKNVLKTRLGPAFYRGLTSAQKNSFDNEPLSSWDISILCRLLEIWYQEAPELEIVTQVRSVRNSICHAPTSALAPDAYENLNARINTIFEKMGIKEEPKQSTLTPSTPKKKDAEAIDLKQKGTAALRKQEFVQAHVLYTQALKIDRTSAALRAEIFCNRCLVELKRENLKNALQDARSAQTLHPRWERGYEREGEVYQALRKWKKATRAFEYALHLNPNNQNTNKLLSECRQEAAKEARSEDLNTNYGPKPSNQEWAKLRNRIGIDMDDDKALKMIEDLQNRGFAEGDIMLAHMYLHGSTKHQKDEREAVKWFTAAAAKGSAEGHYNLGVFRLNGTAVKKDIAIARWHFEEAIKCPPWHPVSNLPNPGVGQAYGALGNMSTNGVGTEIDIQKGLDYYHKGAEINDSGCINNIGSILFGQKKFDEAFKYFTWAAKEGNEMAMWSVGDCYRRGLGTPLDLKKARDYYLQSKENGYLKAGMDLNAVEKELERFPCDVDALTDVMHELTKNSEVLQAFQRLQADQVGSALNTRKGGTKTYSIEKIALCAKTSKTAQRWLESSIYFKRAVAFSHDEKHLEAIPYYAKCLAMESIVSSYTPESLTDLRTSISFVLKKKPSHALLSDANYCHAHMLEIGVGSAALEGQLAFLTKSISQFPETRFYAFRARIHACMRNIPAALKDMDIAIAMGPSEIDFLRDRAQYFRLLGKDFTEIQMEYLEKMEQDHRRYPFDCFNLAVEFMQRKNPKMCRKYYELALETEKKKLPFFPEETQDQRTLCLMALEPYLKIEKPVLSQPKNTLSQSLRDARAKQEAAPSSSSKVFECQSHPQRDQMRSKHRNLIKDTVQMKNRDGSRFSAFSLPPRLPATHSLTINCKEIFLRDMKAQTDEKYPGRFITLTNICCCDKMTSIMSIAQDQYGYPIKFALYNMKDVNNIITPAQLNRLIPVGQKMIVYNPYHRIARDNTAVIRVDDPNMVEFLQPVAQICWFCCAERKELSSCGRCKTARYCGVDCQTKDWKSGHKELCPCFEF